MVLIVRFPFSFLQLSPVRFVFSLVLALCWGVFHRQKSKVCFVFQNFKWVRGGVPVELSLFKLPACLARTDRGAERTVFAFHFGVLRVLSFREGCRRADSWSAFFQRTLPTSRQLLILFSFRVHVRNREQKRVRCMLIDGRR